MTVQNQSPGHQRAQPTSIAPLDSWMRASTRPTCTGKRRCSRTCAAPLFQARGFLCAIDTTINLQRKQKTLAQCWQLLSAAGSCGGAHAPPVWPQGQSPPQAAAVFSHAHAVQVPPDLHPQSAEHLQPSLQQPLLQPQPSPIFCHGLWYLNCERRACKENCKIS
jgi:hypothetical protein